MSTGSPDCSRAANAGARLLVVDDDGEMRDLLAEVLSDAGYAVTSMANCAEALIQLRTESFAAIILDKNLPGLSGLDLLPGLRTICPDTPVIMITAFGDVRSYVDAIEKGAFEYVFKPFRMEELLRVLQRAVSPRSQPAPSASTTGTGR